MIKEIENTKLIKDKSTMKLFFQSKINKAKVLLNATRKKLNLKIKSVKVPFDYDNQDMLLSKISEKKFFKHLLCFQTMGRNELLIPSDAPTLRLLYKRNNHKKIFEDQHCLRNTSANYKSMLKLDFELNSYNFSTKSMSNIRKSINESKTLNILNNDNLYEKENLNTNRRQFKTIEDEKSKYIRLYDHLCRVRSFSLSDDCVRSSLNNLHLNLNIDRALINPVIEMNDNSNEKEQFQISRALSSDKYEKNKCEKIQDTEKENEIIQKQNTCRTSSIKNLHKKNAIENKPKVKKKPQRKHNFCKYFQFLKALKLQEIIINIKKKILIVPWNQLVRNSLHSKRIQMITKYHANRSINILIY